MSGDYFQRLVMRTRGRVPLVVSKLETMLAPPRPATASVPELARAAEAPSVARRGPELEAGSVPEDEPRALAVAPATGDEPRPLVEVPLEITIGRLEIHAAPSPRQLLASARARAGSTLSNYLERRRR